MGMWGRKKLYKKLVLSNVKLHLLQSHRIVEFVEQAWKLEVIRNLTDFEHRTIQGELKRLTIEL